MKEKCQIKLRNGRAIGDDEESDDDCRGSELTASSCHPAAVEVDCKRDCSWRTSRCRNPCLRPCQALLYDSEGVVVAGRGELDWVIKGVSRSFSCSSQVAVGKRNR